MNATILCLGPSLAQAPPPTGFVIAVNGALVHATERVDALASFDPVERHGEWALVAMRAQAYRAPVALVPLNIWTPTPALDGWVLKDIEDARTAYDLAVEHGVWYSHGLPTTVLAIMWAARRGYDPIAVYGADMAGPEAWPGRWGEERELFAAVQRVAGVAVLRR